MIYYMGGNNNQWRKSEKTVWPSFANASVLTIMDYYNHFRILYNTHYYFYFQCLLTLIITKSVNHSMVYFGKFVYTSEMNKRKQFKSDTISFIKIIKLGIMNLTVHLIFILTL